MTIGTDNDITNQTGNEDVDTSTFDELESEVQSYARNFPVIFDRASGVHLYDQNEDEYLDFLAGAGSLNYGHNNPILKEKLLEYIQYDGITHGLDFHTSAKERFLDALSEVIFQPRGMNYMVQFTGPTGSNSVEAALKIARKVKGRHNIIAFTNGFHGVTVGAMATTGNSHHRDASGVPLVGASFMPFDGYFGPDVDTIEYLDQMLSDPSSGIDHPAAAIVEAVQGEGGLNVASFEWLRKLEKVCRKHDMLLILDDIQAGCGRTGTFFSFDNAGISPDIITMSKSLSGYGLPFAVTMIKPEYDQWKPGEHNGTFRGNNHAFVTATTALRHYWSDDTFAKDVRRKGDLLMKRLDEIAGKYSKDLVKSKGRGMMCGLEFATGELAKAVTEYAFEKRLVIETSGSEDQVVKCLMSLTIEDKDLLAGLEILEEATDKAIKDMRDKADRAVA